MNIELAQKRYDLQKCYCRRLDKIDFTVDTTMDGWQVIYRRPEWPVAKIIIDTDIKKIFRFIYNLEGHPYGKEVYGLLYRLQDNGVKITSVYIEGEVEKVDSLEEALDHVLSVDDCNIDTDHGSLYIVLGNEPGVIVCDHTVNDVIEKVSTDHYEEWKCN